VLRIPVVLWIMSGVVTYSQVGIRVPFWRFASIVD
jgi:hypothetical protein